MKFLISKTSDLGNKEPNKPCEKAISEEYKYEGRVIICDENGNDIFQIIPRIGRRWVIEINSIEELMALHNEVNNELIVSDGKPCPEIEIYDTYRE